MLPWFGETRVPLFVTAGAYDTVILWRTQITLNSRCAFTVLRDASGGAVRWEG